MEVEMKEGRRGQRKKEGLGMKESRGKERDQGMKEREGERGQETGK